jgi:hypothetical protein
MRLDLPTTVHQEPFATRFVDGAHVIVDRGGVVVCTVHGEYAHRTAEALVLLLNGARDLAGEIDDLDEVAAAHGCDDALDLEERLDELQHTADEVKRICERNGVEDLDALELHLDKQRDLIRDLERDLASYRAREERAALEARS